jgi:hypothetical protein
VEANPKLAELHCDWPRLIERFNLTVGVASAFGIAFQQAFVVDRVVAANAAAYLLLQSTLSQLLITLRIVACPPALSQPCRLATDQDEN